MKNSAEYQRAYREAVPEAAERDRVYKAAFNRARRRLADTYPRVFAALLAEELAAAGYERTGMGGPGAPKVRRDLGVPRKSAW